MGCFDYSCFIRGNSCLEKDSNGQECSFGTVYLVDKKLTKKIICEYTGYGSAYVKSNSNIEVYDLGCVDEDEELNSDWSYSNFACPNCAKNISNEVKNINQFFDE